MQKRKATAKNPAKKFNPLIQAKALTNIIQELPEYRKKKAASIEFRRNVIESQNRDNFQNEYDRLRGYMSSHSLPGLEETRLKQRMESLTNSYNKSVNTTGSLYRDSLKKAMTKQPQASTSTQT